MTTASEIIIRARRRVGVHSDEEPLEAAEAVASLEMLQDMLASWVLDRSIKSFSAATLVAPVSVTIFDDSELGSEATFAIVANLAARIAGAIGAPISPDILVDADGGKEAIAKMHVRAQLTPSTFDAGIVNMPSQRRFGVTD